MPNISEIYPSGNYLSVQTAINSGLIGKNLAIKDAVVESIGVGDAAKQKVALSIVGSDKKLALNATNAKIIAQKFGDDFSKWAGRQIMLVIVKVKFKGELMDSIQSVPQ